MPVLVCLSRRCAVHRYRRSKAGQVHVPPAAGSHQQAAAAVITAAVAAADGGGVRRRNLRNINLKNT